MIELCALASGSNGNAYYVGNHSEAVLIDAGLSAKQLKARFEAAHLDLGKVRAVFVSHEHSDHARGVQTLSKRFNIPVYMNSRTFYALPKPMRPDHVRFFQPGDSITIGGFTVHTFSKNHDAAEPCSFRVEYNGFSTGVLTDIGEPCNEVKNAVQKSHALFLESNYDHDMLWNGTYPWYLKNRVSSDKGHLSNKQAAELVNEHGHPELEAIFLSHISKENNRSELALETFQSLQRPVELILTSRTDVSEIYRVKKSILV